MDKVDLVARNLGERLSKLEKSTEHFLSPADVAQILSISRWTVYGWVYRGKLRAVKAGRLLRIPRSEIARLLKWRN